MSERKITQKTRDVLNEYKELGLPLYFNKICDRFTSGIPDFQGTFYAISFYIELKDEGEDARKLQKWHLRQAERAGAQVLSTDDFNAVVLFLENIRHNHVKLMGDFLALTHGR